MTLPTYPESTPVPLGVLVAPAPPLKLSREALQQSAQRECEQSAGLGRVAWKDREGEDMGRKFDTIDRDGTGVSCCVVGHRWLWRRFHKWHMVDGDNGCVSWSAEGEVAA